MTQDRDPDSSSPWPDVDVLFAGEPPAPPTDVTPRVRRLQLLITIALGLDVLGLFLTVVPGAAVTLWAWLAADNEAIRIEAGGYEETAAASVMGIRSVARWAMIFCVVCLLVQAWMLHRGSYNALWAGVADALTGLLARLS